MRYRPFVSGVPSQIVFADRSESESAKFKIKPPPSRSRPVCRQISLIVHGQQRDVSSSHLSIATNGPSVISMLFGDAFNRSADPVWRSSAASKSTETTTAALDKIRKNSKSFHCIPANFIVDRARPILESPSSNAESIRRWRWIVLVLVITSLAVVAAWNWSKEALFERPPTGVSPADYQAAKQAFRREHRYDANRNDTLYLLAEKAIAEKRLEIAVACFAEIPTSHPDYGRMARYGQGITLVALYRAVEAEQQLRELISLEEASPKIKPEYLIHARQRLRHLLEVALRFEERHRLLRQVIDRDADQTFEPVAACFPTLVRWNGPDAVQWIEHFQASNPDDPQLNIALGRYRTSQGRLSEARQILEGVVRQHPKNLSALAALIACLREADDPDETTRIVQTLPPRSPNDPWLLLLQRGALAMQDGKHEEAAAAYEQLIQQDRTCVEAWHGLGQAARLLNDAPRSKKALNMSTSLGRIQNQLAKAIQESSSPSSFLDIADQCSEISLNREGAIMTRCARRLAPTNERVQTTVKYFRERLVEDHEPPLLGQ
jgi:tetratricopeptide (TPR) repeat protein